jgi:glycerol-3-phosphate O-acyltransferase
LRAIIDGQRTLPKPIVLVPQVFVWSKHGDAAQHTPVDAVFGPREWPGKMRTIAQFLANYRHVTLRAGPPLDVRAFIASETGAGDEVLVRRMTYALLRRLERERRGVLGPTRKPSDRMRDEVLRSPRLQKVIGDMAGEGDPERRVLNVKANSMLKELEASLDMNMVAMLDAGVDQTVGRMYSSIEVDQPGLQRIREAAKDGTLVLLPSHKSHVDYMILSQVLYQAHMQMPLIAAGDNLNFFPVGPLLRKAGAFFIRRSFKGDRLYGAVVDAYMRRLLKDGWTLEFFLEGGRSRTGKLLPPKVGLLSIIVDAALGSTGQSIQFVPVSIGYERFVEEDAYVAELSGGEKSKEDVRGLLGSVDILARRYGRLSVQFGELLTLEGVLKELDPQANTSALAQLTPARRRAVVTRLAYRVMNEINRVTAVTAGSLVACALLVHGKRGLAHDELITLCERIARSLHAFGARFSPSLSHPKEPGRIRLEALREALELFVKAGHVHAKLPGDTGRKESLRGPRSDAIYIVDDDARMSLDLAKNVIIHFFVSRALVATAVLAHSVPSIGVSALRERVLVLSKLFKYEFQFRADATFDAIFDETLAAMVADGELEREGDVVTSHGDAGRAQVVLYRQLIRNFVESYRVAARSLALLIRAPMPLKDLTKRAIGVGERMYLAGEIERREAVSRPVIENAYAAFVDLQFLNRSDGKLSLPTSYASADTVATIEARITAFIDRRRD